jgi:hypothetical protein
MSRKEKLLEKVRQAPGNTKWKQLLKLMNSYGFSEKKTEEGAMFPHPALADDGVMPRVPKPHSDKVKQPYVNQCLKAIDLLLEKGEKK